MATLNFGYMIFDGSRALTKGDYIRPQSGEYAGQLGPWSKLVQKVGIDPESNAMKTIFIVWGITGMFITISFAMGQPWGWKAMLIVNICSLWYLMMGTMSGIIQILLLLLLKFLKNN